MGKARSRTNALLPLLHSLLLFPSRPGVLANSVIGHETFGRVEVILRMDTIAPDHLRELRKPKTRSSDV